MFQRCNKTVTQNRYRRPIFEICRGGQNVFRDDFFPGATCSNQTHDVLDDTGHGGVLRHRTLHLSGPYIPLAASTISIPTCVGVPAQNRLVTGLDSFGLMNGWCSSVRHAHDAVGSAGFQPALKSGQDGRAPKKSKSQSRVR